MIFSVIHFSDIHIYSEKDIVLSRSKEIAQACAGVLPRNSRAVAVISGDIAYSGQQDQYSLAETFFSEIATHIKQETGTDIAYVFSPGNHDCDFSSDNSVRNILLQNVKPDDVTEGIYEQIVSPQRNYVEFTDKMGNKCDELICLNEFEVNGRQVLFMAVNTAWMSVLHENPGKIIIPNLFLKKIEMEKYAAVFAVFHHPDNWLNPDYRRDFTDYVCSNADMVLVGHEHSRDQYKKIGNAYALIYNHGKELQDGNSEQSAFSVICFDECFSTFTVYDYQWQGNCYARSDGRKNNFIKNPAAYESVFYPNEQSLAEANDVGMTIHHFSKQEIHLEDVFVWPDFDKVTYRTDKKTTEHIREGHLETLEENNVNLLVGSSQAGKSAISKYLFLHYASKDVCCIRIDGRQLTSTDPSAIQRVIEKAFSEQYASNKINEFRLLTRAKKILVIDNLDESKVRGEKRNQVIEFLHGYFDRIFMFVSNEYDAVALLPMKVFREQENVFSYTIRPFGNRKRRELISKWYNLGEDSLEEGEIEKRIDTGVSMVNKFIGNGTGIMPALPFYILYVLQNTDSISPSNSVSQYGYLYESMIKKSLAETLSKPTAQDQFSIYVGVVSQLAFEMLKNNKTYFTKDDLKSTISVFSEQKKVELSLNEVLDDMCKARIFYRDTSEGDIYKFKYPYMFYYFSGRFIAYHLNNPDVQKQVEHMSSRLYIEDFGNIMIFVCHYANNREIIETILYNAYSTLEDCAMFDFSSADAIVPDLALVDKFLIPESVGNNSDVERNKQNQLEALDQANINDGQVSENPSNIEDKELEETERKMAAISAAFRTLDVLGQILQNYPGDIDGELKVDVVDEMHKLGMRATQAIIDTMSQIEESFVEFIVDRAIREGKAYSRDSIAEVAKKFIEMLISSAIRGMINKIALSLNSHFLLVPAREALQKDGSTAAELILLDLKVNYLNKVDFQEISAFKKKLDDSGERLAASILASIMAYYLSYNVCDYKLRAKICSLFGFSEQAARVAGHTKLLEQGIS